MAKLLKLSTAALGALLAITTVQAGNLPSCSASKLVAITRARLRCWRPTVTSMAWTTLASPRSLSTTPAEAPSSSIARWFRKPQRTGATFRPRNQLHRSLPVHSEAGSIVAPIWFINLTGRHHA